ncbi:MAG: DUF4469 domain-containing protein [Tannerella sp.]|jgi:hypothetical protein|nr:DUF4469 domain-containing protein [Tannerella sp.]
MANSYHRIRAYLYKNLLTDDPNDYSIRVIPERTLNITQVCEIAASRGGADISAAAMEHAVELWFKEMAYQLCDSFSINTGWFRAAPQVKGIANTPNEHYNADKHSLVFEFQQGVLLRREIEGIEVEFLGVADTDGLIAQVIDVKTGSVNDLLTPGRNLRISGDKLKIAGSDPAVGIRFRNLKTDAVTVVDPTDLVVNNPSELIVVIPDLDSGTSFQLEVTTQYAVSSLLKQPRTITFIQPLTVP